MTDVLKMKTELTNLQARWDSVVRNEQRLNGIAHALAVSLWVSLNIHRIFTIAFCALALADQRRGGGE